VFVRGVPYLLQEIYGFPDATSKSSEDDNGGNRDASQITIVGSSDSETTQPECVVCLSGPKDTIVLPCRHLCVCKECALRVRRQTRKCPICRQEFHSLLHMDNSIAVGPPTPHPFQTPPATNSVLRSDPHVTPANAITI
jgi:Zinc finger, C3HC4 type (RING finger)